MTATPTVSAPSLHLVSNGPRWRLLARIGSTPADQFAASALQTLSETPRRLDQRWLYDGRGSRIYDAITRTPEYYLTRVEDQILAAHATDIIGLCPGATLVELGSGSSIKTRRLLEAALHAGPSTYVPIDISRDALIDAAHTLTASYPSLKVEALHATFTEGLSFSRTRSPRLVLFLGSTIGNVRHSDLPEFLAMLRDHLDHRDHLLLGIDLAKDRATLEAAYNDEAGHTEAFTRNMIARMNRELGCEIDPARVAHQAIFDPEIGGIVISSVFLDGAHLEILGASIQIAPGEAILQEVSLKFDLESFQALCVDAGFEVAAVFTDDRRWFANLLLRPAR